MVGKLIFTCSPSLFNCLIEKFNEELAVTCELVYCRIACPCLHFMPSERFIVGENIQYRKKALAWEILNPCISKIITVVNGEAQEICYGVGQPVTGS